jgi:hypothetical protein
MKTKQTLTVLLLLGFALALATTACDDGKDTHTHEWEWVVTNNASYDKNGLETETCSCGATNGTRPIPHPTPTVFSDIALFETYTATIKDERTTCTSQNLDQLGIVTQIKEAITTGFDEGTGMAAAANKNRFRRVFSTENSVTIIVDNPATPYKLKAPDANTIFIHIVYLQNNSANIKQNFIDATRAMDTADSTPLPFEVE